MNTLRIVDFGLRIVAATAVAALGALAQQPRVTNAQLSTRPAGGALEREFRAALKAHSAGWIGYAVPVVAGRHNMCCNSSDECCGHCSLEDRSGTHRQPEPRAQSGPIQLEGARYFNVLFRADQGAVTKIRTFSSDCELDAGGLPFVWLTGVGAGESITLLSQYVTARDAVDSSGRRGKLAKPAEGALSAIALHGDPAADRALEQFIASSQPEELRKKTAFWMGVARGRRGVEVLRKLVREDPSGDVREGAVFALYVSKEPDATEPIIQAARNDASAKVRGQALFWLAQKASRQAAGAITEAIQNDPETDVKKKAVFALSQLPKDQGVPLLIQVARNNRNPEVRKQAFFWLGQSKDSRAVAFMEEVLTGSR